MSNPPVIWRALRRRVSTMFALPVLEKELSSAARRKRTFVFRTLYMTTLLCVVYLTKLSWTQNDYLPFTYMPRLGRDLFEAFSICQFVLVVILAPALAAGAVASEKDKRTLGVLFTTDLRSYEIVVGKLLACLLNVQFLVLSGAPIMCVCLMFGGVSLGEIVAVFVTTSATGLLACSLTLLFSVVMRKGYAAAMISYIILFVSGLGPPIAVEALFTGGGLGQIIHDVETYINPVFVMLGTLADDSHHVFANKASWIGGVIVCSLVCALLSFVCLMISAWLLRRAADWNAAERLKTIFAAMDRFFERHNFLNIHLLKAESREVWRNPVAWREVKTRAFGKGRYFLRLIYGSVILMMLLCLIFPNPMVDADAQVVVLCIQLGIVLLTATVLSASSISSEKDAQSFDLLLTTTISPREIIIGKWLGVARYAGIALCFLIGDCAIASALGVIDASSFPLVTMEATVCTVFFIAVGIFFSLLCESSTRAFIWTLIVLLVMCGGTLVLDELLLTNEERYSSKALLGLGGAAKCFLHFGSPFSWIAESVKPRLDRYRHTYSWYWASDMGQAWQTLKTSVMSLWLVGYAVGAAALTYMTTALFDKLTGRCA